MLGKAYNRVCRYHAPLRPKPAGELPPAARKRKKILPFFTPRMRMSLPGRAGRTNHRMHFYGRTGAGLWA